MHACIHTALQSTCHTVRHRHGVVWCDAPIIKLHNENSTGLDLDGVWWGERERSSACMFIDHTWPSTEHHVSRYRYGSMRHSIRLYCEVLYCNILRCLNSSCSSNAARYKAALQSTARHTSSTLPYATVLHEDDDNDTSVTAVHIHIYQNDMVNTLLQHNYDDC